MCDDARCNRTVVDGDNGSRSVLETLGKRVPIGERKGYARVCSAAVNERIRIDRFSMGKREGNREKKVIRRRDRSDDMRR